MKAIQYDSRSTTNGQPVGTVFVLDIDHISPGSYSYTKDATEATVWPDTEAERLIRNHAWNNARTVEPTA